MWNSSGVFIANFEHVSDIFLLFLLAILTVKQLNVCWGLTALLIQNIVGTPLSAGGRVEPPTKFSKWGSKRGG